jgi:hypothetical protein
MKGAYSGAANSVSHYYWFYSMQIAYQRCASIAVPYQVNVRQMTKPIVSPAGPLKIMTPVTLSVPSGFGYLWSTGENTQSITVNVAGSYWVKTIVSGCTSEASEPVLVTINRAYVWQGIGSFNESAKWSTSKVPVNLGLKDTLYIRSGACQLDQTRIAANLVVEAGAILDLGVTTMRVTNVFLNNGQVISTGDGSLDLFQASAKTTNPIAVANLRFEKVTLDGSFKAVKAMLCLDTVRLGTTATRLILGSTQSFTAYYSAESSMVLVGNPDQFIIERWIDPSVVNGTGAWYQMGVPIKNLSVNQYKQGGAFATGTFNNALRTNSSLYLYDPFNLIWPTNQGWTKPASNHAASIGEGARVWFYKNRISAGPLQFNGIPFNDTLKMTLKYCASGCAYQSPNGFNLLGNPYAGTLDWDLVEKTNVAQSLWVWRQDLLQYASYVNGVGVNGGSNLVASGQGYFALALGATAKLAYKPTDASVQSQQFYKRPAVSNVLRIKLHQLGKAKDEIALRMAASATVAYDPDFDALKYQSGAVSLYSIGSGQEKYAIEAQPKSNTTKFAIQVRGLSGSVTDSLSFEGIATLESGYSAYLILPSAPGQMQLSEGLKVGIAATDTNGMSVVFMKSTLGLGVQQNKFSLYPNPTTGIVRIVGQNEEPTKLQLTDVLGKLVLEAEMEGSEKQLDLGRFPSGSYYLRVNGEVYKLIRLP